MPVSFCSVSPHRCSEGIIRVFIGLRLFEIAVFLFYRYFGSNTQQQPSPQPPPPSSPLPALTNAILHGPCGDDFRGKSHPRKHAGLPQQRLLRGLHGLFPPESPACFSRLFSPALGFPPIFPALGVGEVRSEPGVKGEKMWGPHLGGIIPWP